MFIANFAIDVVVEDSAPLLGGEGRFRVTSMLTNCKYFIHRACEGLNDVDYISLQS